MRRGISPEARRRVPKFEHFHEIENVILLSEEISQKSILRTNNHQNAQIIAKNP